MSQQTSTEALIARYQELYTSFREAVSTLFKGSTLVMAIFAAGLGYILKSPLPVASVRIICGFFLIMLLL